MSYTNKETNWSCDVVPWWLKQMELHVAPSHKMTGRRWLVLLEMNSWIKVMAMREWSEGETCGRVLWFCQISWDAWEKGSWKYEKGTTGRDESSCIWLWFPKCFLHVLVLQKPAKLKSCKRSIFLCCSDSSLGQVILCSQKGIIKNTNLYSTTRQLLMYCFS